MDSFQKMKKHISKIVDFYRDECSWDKTQSPVHPGGYTHFEIIHNWSDEKLEFSHDYIQWLFPLKEPSNFNPDAPLLTDEDIAIFKNDPELLEAVFQSFNRFLKFLGLVCRYDNQLQKLVTKKIEAGLTGIGDEFLTKNEVDKKQILWTQPNHNWMRITRCLTSLRLLGHEEASASLFSALCVIYNENVGVTQNTFDYWCQTQQ